MGACRQPTILASSTSLKFLFERGVLFDCLCNDGAAARLIGAEHERSRAVQVVVERRNAQLIECLADKGVLVHLVLALRVAELAAQRRDFGNGETVVFGEDDGLARGDLFLDLFDDCLLRFKISRHDYLRKTPFGAALKNFRTADRHGSGKYRCISFLPRRDIEPCGTRCLRYMTIVAQSGKTVKRFYAPFNLC